MSPLAKLFGGKGPQFAFQLARTRSFTQAVVGESNYQTQLGKIAGGKTEWGAKLECEALLVCDDQNQFDANAIQVKIKGKVVGYLPKEDAEKFRSELRSLDTNLPVVSASAKIVGGWLSEESEGDFGVKLNIKWPLSKATS